MIDLFGVINCKCMCVEIVSGLYFGKFVSEGVGIVMISVEIGCWSVFGYLI